MDIAATLKKTRVSKGLTQSQLAAQAHVALATIQNLEAGKANPSISTLEAIVQILGFDLILQPRQVDWDLWSSLGVPLIQKHNGLHLRPSRDLLKENLVRLPLKAFNDRETVALTSFFSALEDHYPSVWIPLPTELHRWQKKMRSRINSQLRRMALERLSEYL